MLKDSAMARLKNYPIISHLFEYPGPLYPQRVRDVKALFDRDYLAAATELDRFLHLLPVASPLTMQELFTRSFDIQAITTLDIGYVLFGDDYKRGELLANLNREHLKAGVDCGTELADYLPNLLRLMAHISDEELASELVEELLVPSIKIMISEFEPLRVKTKNESYEKHYKTLIEDATAQMEVNLLYQYALKSMYEVLKQDFTFTEKITSDNTNDFLKSVLNEHEIEEKAENRY